MTIDDHYQKIYASKAQQYDAMVSREDYEGNILKALTAIRPLEGLDVIEMGAGTGRLTRLLAPVVRSIQAFDASQHMLDTAAESLEVQGMSNWILEQADNRDLPADDAVADLAIAGWSFAHAQGWYPDRWQIEAGKMVDEMLRVLKPGGTAVILETMGTGNEKPAPPHERLAAYYHWLENEHGFSYKWIRTDYEFDSVEQADELTRFFFGDELADRIVREQMTILPECTGVWWRTR